MRTRIDTLLEELSLENDGASLAVRGPYDLGGTEVWYAVLQSGQAYRISENGTIEPDGAAVRVRG